MSNVPSVKNAGLILLSAGVLTFEITLTRLFAIQQFHHFAFVVVSLAVMGFAASGVILSLRTKPHPLHKISLGFSIAIAASYITINYLPFDSYSIGSDPKQIWILLLYFALTGTPFLFAGWTIGACLAESGTEAHQPYAANFIGSALGCLIAIASISILGGESTIILSIALGFMASAFFSGKRSSAIPFAITALILLLATILYGPTLQIQLSPYKSLAIARLFPDAKETLTLRSMSSRLDIIETNSVHVFPGMSLNMVGVLPEQIGFFVDGSGPIPVTKLAPDSPTAQNVASYLPSAIAHELRPAANVLILNPGAGQEVLFALASGARNVTIPSDEPLILEALGGAYRDFSNNLLDDSRISISSRTSRGVLASSESSYDILLYALTDSFRPITSGAFSLSENYTLTVDSLSQALNRLNDDGILMLSRWLGTPPSESARTWAIAIAALRGNGISEPSDHLAAFRGMRTGTILASPKAFTHEELNTIRDFIEQNSYDPIHLPDLRSEELNQNNRLPVDNYFTLFRDLLQKPETIIDSYDFNLRPPTDDNPFFYHFFRWRQTPDVIAELGVRWQPFGGSGYLVLLALLALMVVLAIPLSILPMLLLNRRGKANRPGWVFTVYFGLLGVGYLLIEIPLIQKFTLLLDRPAFAFAIVLFAMLLTSGIGSLFSRRIPLRQVLLILVAYLCVLTLVSPTLVEIALPWGMFARALLTLLLIAPAGFMMGIPFAAGLRELEIRGVGLIPWAWAINGAISGISGVLAAMITLDLGLKATILIGTFTYFGAFLCSSKFDDTGERNLATPRIHHLSE
jgi:hypothetical protein